MRRALCRRRLRSSPVLWYRFKTLVCRVSVCVCVSQSSQSSAHQGERKLRVMERLTVGPSSTHTEHMSNCCIFGSNLSKREKPSNDFGSIIIFFWLERIYLYIYEAWFIISSSTNGPFFKKWIIAFMKTIFTHFHIQNMAL